MRARLGIVAVILASGCLAACQGTVQLEEDGAPRQVWPEPPAQARIEFVRAFSSLEDFGIRSSPWRRLLNFATGGEVTTMARPMAVAVGAEGELVFVADPDAHCIHRYNLARGSYRCLRTKDDEKLVSPVGLAITEKDELFVADSERAQVYAVQANGRWLERMPIQVRLKRPTGLFWDVETGHLLVVDTGLQSILVLDRNGALVRQIGGRGDQPGQLNYPTYVWKGPEGNIIVTDSLNFRVQRLDSDGRYLSSFGVVGDEAGDFARPKGVATDSAGHIYVVDALFHAVQIFDSNGRLLLSIGGQGQELGRFWLPNGIFITKSNMIFVTDAYNKRVQVLRYVGPDK